MIILDNIFFGFWVVLGDFFVLFLVLSVIASVVMSLFDLLIPR